MHHASIPAVLIFPSVAGDGDSRHGSPVNGIRTVMWFEGKRIMIDIRGHLPSESRVPTDVLVVA